MRVRIQPGIPTSIEVDSTIFNNAEAVERFIKTLRVAKQVVWPDQDKKK